MLMPSSSAKSMLARPISADVLGAIGNTPMVKLDGVHVKLEYLNPSGSIKDRIAKYIVEKAEQKGLLKPGYTIVEATTGNTGIAFSMVAAIKGYKMLVVMPEGLSDARQKMMLGFGAKVKFVKGACAACAVELAKKISKKPGHYMPAQFENQWNVEENESLMANEILQQLDKVDAMVAGIGTGGTLIGVGKALKKHFPNMAVVGVEPSECSLLTDKPLKKAYLSSFHKCGNLCIHHKIEGIGDGFVPDIILRNRDIIDEVMPIKSKDAIKATKLITEKFGCFVGISSGANFLAAKRLLKDHKNVVTFFPDSGMRYLSGSYHV